MSAICEEEVPQAEHFGEGRRAGAEGEDGWEGVQFGAHALANEIQAELRVDNGEDLVHQCEPLVDAVHRTPHIARTLVRNESVEGDECFGLAARGVEEGCSEDIHALNISAWF